MTDWEKAFTKLAEVIDEATDDGAVADAVCNGLCPLYERCPIEVDWKRGDCAKLLRQWAEDECVG